MMPDEEQRLRQAVVAEALSWVGTKYHHMGRIKIIRDSDGGVVDRGSVDCAQYIYMVFRNLDLTEELPLEYYPPDWHMNRASEKYMGIVLQRAHEITEDKVQPGDVVLFRWGRAYAHGGIVIEPGFPAIVHAYSHAGFVMPDSAVTGRLADRPRKFFSRW